MGGRRHWVQADVRCLLCGRFLGQLLGVLPASGEAVRTTAGRVKHFSAFQPADPGAPIQRVGADPFFRCSACGGRGIFEEVETFSVYDDDAEDEQEGRPRRGRRPKPWRHLVDARLASLGSAG